MARVADKIGLVTMVAFAVGFAACESDETPDPNPVVPATNTSSPSTTTGDGGSGGDGVTTTSSAGGQGGAGGMGGAGGQGQCMPMQADPPFLFCGGTGSVGSSMGTTCNYCVEANGGDEYEVECTDGTCTCLFNDSPVCTCQNAPNAGCSDSCCPEPWGAELSPGVGGGGGAGGGTPTTVVSTSVGSTGSG